MSFELLAGRDHSAHPELALWHGNIGQSVALDLAPPAPPAVQQVDVLCWNLAIGRAYLDELVMRLKSEALGNVGVSAHRPLVMLLQEVYRADPTVPETTASRHHGGHRPVGARRDIIDFAAEHNFSLRYAPSMRNGHHRSDRGNAVLSNVAIVSARAFVLPYIRQRRVVVKAELQGLPWLTLVSAHLDTGGQLPRVRGLGRFGAGRAAQTEELIKRVQELGEGRSVIVGADLNSPRGARDPAVRVLERGGLQHAQGGGSLGHSFHGPIRLLLDHVLYRSDDGRIASVEVTRLDETRDDAGRRVFGSDHHPLLARVQLNL
ncbi:MAG: endonuclease/exonuclease/phosphatase family protein [Longimicrobiales bacterium]